MTARYYVILDTDCAAETTYPIDTDEQENAARAAMRESGIESLPVYTGDHDDSVRTDRTLFAGNAGPQ